VIEDICIGPSGVYAVGWKQSGTPLGVVYRLDAQGWTPIFQSTQVQSFGACIELPSRDLLVAGAGKAELIHPDGGSDVETLPQIANSSAPNFWEALLQVGPDVYASGYSRRLAKRSGGGWTTLLEAPAGSNDPYPWFTLVSTRPGEIHAAGRGRIGSVGPRVVLDDGGITIFRDPPAFDVYEIWPASDSVYFFAGQKDPDNLSFFKGAVYRATR
jgi:hypothetical protein